MPAKNQNKIFNSGSTVFQKKSPKLFKELFDE